MNGNMTAFESGSLPLPPREEFVKTHTAQGIPRKVATHAYYKLKADEIWLNDQYQVNIDKDPPHSFGKDSIVWHLSIKRLDKNPIHDWRDLQEIKNRLCGLDAEAVELYPNDKRVVDTANQFHLWVFMQIDGEAKPTLGFGWTHGLKSDTGINNSKQRNFSEGATA